MGWLERMHFRIALALLWQRSSFFEKSPRPSFLIKRAALGNLKASFHCTHWHRFFPLKRAPPLTPTLSPSGEREETALLGARNRYALRMAGHQSPRQIVRDGTAWGIAVYSLQLIVYGWFRGYLLITCRILVIFLVVSGKKRNFGGKLYKLNNRR